MRVDRSHPGIELWCLHRREGTGFFMMRLTKHATTTRMLHKGELRPELASLLCALSEPHDRDVFVDPFCGYGSIPLARARLAPYKTIHASDNDLDKINYLRKKLRTGATRYPSGSFQVNCGDALSRNTFRNDSVDKIVTDPPWGIFDDTQTVDIDRLYHDMLKECMRILKPGGILVILTARKELLSHCMQHHRGTLGVTDTYHILVSGKKAVVYKLAKR
jgi:tRNA G10  N-methylase Trm11